MSNATHNVAQKKLEMKHHGKVTPGIDSIENLE